MNILYEGSSNGKSKELELLCIEISTNLRVTSTKSY